MKFDDVSKAIRQFMRISFFFLEIMFVKIHKMNEKNNIYIYVDMIDSCKTQCLFVKCQIGKKKH